MWSDVFAIEQTTVILGSDRAKMASNTVAEGAVEKTSHPHGPQVVSVDEKVEVSVEKHVEDVDTSDHNLVYDDVDEEPELHARTYIALVAMFLLNMVQVLALQGPPAVVSLQSTIDIPALLREFWTDHALSRTARMDWKRPQQPTDPNLDPQFAFPRTSSARTGHFFRLRYLPSPKIHSRWLIARLPGGRRHRPWL